MSETPCPEMAGLAVAEELLEKHAGSHQYYAAARERLAIFREVTERLHAALPCTPTINWYGNLVCSLSAVHAVVMDASLAPVNGSLWAIPLGEDSGPTGAML